MTMIDTVQRALVIAPHPDDEVLGCGGTIARLVALGRHVEVAIATRGREPQFDAGQVEQVQAEARRAHALLGVTRTHFLDFPAAELDRIPRAELNRGIAELVAQCRPDALFVPFAHDLHFDHGLIFEAAMVAARPVGAQYPARILAYETVSETNWAAPYLTPAFQPNLFIDISDHLDHKIEAFGCFASQVRPFPNERSPETLRALAQVRGSCVSKRAAEAFVMIREVS
ncbi:LmbE family protein [Sphingobium herbicidovorans NBRC 16415]|uniref:LmbE family protein n=1 Tax=Sphingobium herbicidovorans (strain ATCC 700291 / DSM 11019 / CCUG 56400 / KCTC 2939 / LMG 18315 / NBRC 16415 / MH) TaxID=1219045 RepID=A0A086PAP7_SPHHM|nr:PIG-L deacetylase family protein [Sphingobium herbicidovorans]KFG90465.1 LmbE family protein [Sphingobium herbicidovorans NBRC 16415]